MNRIRQDFEAVQTGCPNHMRPMACALPDDCSQCQRFVCNACEQVTPWEEGGADAQRKR